MSGSALRVARHTVSVLVAALAVLVLGAPPAAAHGELARSDPPAGGVVAVGRTELTLWFTEAVDAEASTVALRTIDGADVPVTVSTTGDGTVLGVETPPLARATYVLDWRTLSADDGHQSRGSVVFGAGVRPSVVPAAAVGLPGAPTVVLRWLDLCAIMLAIGALAVSGRVLRSTGEQGHGARRRARVIAALAAGAAVVCGALAPLLLTRDIGGFRPAAALDLLTGTPWGHLWSARWLALVVAAVSLGRWAATRDGSRALVRAALVALAVVVGLEAVAGHAATLPARSVPATIASASHLVAAGVWAGGLAVLGVCLLPLLRDAPARGALVAQVFQAFSPVAAVAAGVLLATGLYEAGRHVPTLGALTTTVYGAAVVGKAALLAVALTVAGVNTLLVNPALAAPVGRRLGRPAGWTPVPLRMFPALVAAEVLVLVVAVGAAAVLTSVPTAREVASATRDTTVHAANVDGLFVTFEVVPAGPEASRLIVRIRSTVKPEPAPVSAVEVLLEGPDGTIRAALDPVEPGRYEAETVAPAPGRWTASVAVQRGDLPITVARTRWTVTPPAPDGPGAAELATTALAVLLLVGTAAAILRTRRRAVAATTSPDQLVGSLR
ncbi:copper resistance protein CopC [Cellulomonas sp.]|uniref:copper resistance CopC/CopD family protein n=1 Tax=Cellulomonas sp. TaxID=40001 RepID=UPI003BABC7C8